MKVRYLPWVWVASAAMGWSGCAITDGELDRWKGADDGTSDGLGGSPTDGSGSTDAVDGGDGTTTPEPRDPVAVCAVTPTSVNLPAEPATWLGGDSYDPEGEALVAHRWRLIQQPNGSAVMLPAEGSANLEGFFADQVGTYVAELTVETEDGRSSRPCEAILEAVPGPGLWVELFWEMADDDMDLHLVREGASLESPTGDCYAATCLDGLDWGVVGSAYDDPTLDLNDIVGTGPENINIPGGASGVYTIYVNDVSGTTGDTPSSNTATVRIYVNGSRLFDGSHTFGPDDEGSYVPFATVSFPEESITSLL